jgi:hypothetical protein
VCNERREIETAFKNCRRTGPEVLGHPALHENSKSNLIKATKRKQTELKVVRQSASAKFQPSQETKTLRKHDKNANALHSIKA